MDSKNFIICSHCGKKLMERLPNGLFSFKFGQRPGSPAIVDLKIQGNVKMLCLRRSCRKENVINFFPGIENT